ncbi:MAG: MFS transporter, partial [Flavobacterium sp.]
MDENTAPGESGFFKKNPALKIKEFRSFLAIRFGLIFALNMQITIIFYWVYHITNDKLSLGFVGLAEVIPAVACALFAGHFADLNEKRKMVLFCITAYIILGMSLFMLTTPFAFNRLGLDTTLLLIYFLVFCGGIIRSFLGPSVFSLFGLIVPRKNFANGTSWSSMAWQTGAMLGPLAAGILIAMNGINAGMLAIVIVEVLLLIPILS